MTANRFTVSTAERLTEKKKKNSIKTPNELYKKKFFQSGIS